MNPKRRAVPLPVTIALFALLALIPPFAWLQYQWAEVVSKAEEQRMRENLRATGLQFMTSFDNESTVIQDMLEAERGADAAAARDFVERAVAFWRANASWPEVLRSVSLVTLEPGAGPWYERVVIDTYARTASAGDRGAPYNWKVERLSSADADVAAAVLALPGLGGAVRLGTEPSPVILLSRVPAFLHARVVSADPLVALISRVDEQALAGQLLPSLAERYFGEPDGLRGYALRVISSSGGREVFSSGGYDPGRGAELRLPLLGSWRGDRMIIRSDGRAPDFPRVRYWLQSGNRPPPEPDNAPWILEIQRVSGSFEAAAANIRALNLVGSIGLLAIISAGLVWIYRLYRQSRLLVHAQEDFVATVSHELKTPLSVVRGAAENLREGVVADAEHARRYGERMVAEADRLLGLTENVLFYARLEAGAGIPAARRESVELDRFLRTVVQGWKGAFSERGAVLSFHDTVRASTVVAGERAALSALVDNLLSNALRYGMPAEGEGRVEVVLGNRYVRRFRGLRSLGRHGELVGTGSDILFTITVRDNGPGLPAHERRKLFQPFYRPNGSLPGGIGLGLSLVRRIALAHGGRVRAEAAEGGGLAVVVELPSFGASR